MRARISTIVASCLLLPALAHPGPADAAEDRPARYCPSRDAYEVTDCVARPGVPQTPMRAQLRWLQLQLSGSAADITAREIRDHVAPEMLAAPGSGPSELVTAFRQTLQRFGPMRFAGFSYPPRSHQAMALFRADNGSRVEVPVAIARRTRMITALEVREASPVLVPRGRYSGWFDVGGRELFMRCVGHGRPTVVLENGLTTDWYQLQNRLATTTRVCSYDPARQNGPASRSDSARGPRTADDRVRDLHRLLRAAGVPRPLVLVGHSNGGLFSMGFASQHPGAVAGLVLVDGVHPRYHRSTFEALRHLVPQGQWDAAYSQLCAVPARQVDWERMDICRAERQVRAQLAAHPLRPMPLTVISHGRAEGPPSAESDVVEQLWARLQADLAGMLPGARHVIAQRSGHDIQHSQPRLVLREVRRAIRAVRLDP